MECIQKKHELILSKISDIHRSSFFSKQKLPKLVAVSKKQEDYKIDKAIECGQKFFAENRVQEAHLRWQKRLKINKDLELRLIGPLQTNKVKIALNLFDIIETIDREKLANEIAKNFNNNVKTKSFYIQINTGNETQKSGLNPLQADSFIKYCESDLNLPIFSVDEFIT